MIIKIILIIIFLSVYVKANDLKMGNSNSFDVENGSVRSTFTAHTSHMNEIFVSTINGGSPLAINGVAQIRFADNSIQNTAAFASSATFNNVTIDGGKLYLENTQQSYIFYDLASNWVRHFLNGAEMFRLEN